MPNLQDIRNTSNVTGSVEKVDDLTPTPELNYPETPITYRLYKRRFLGLVGLILLNIIGAMSWPWFGPISNDVADDFGITLDQVNWLGNIMYLTYLPISLVVPLFIRRYGIRRCSDFGSLCLLLSAWIRYAGTARSLSKEGAYTLLMVGQFFASIAQPVFQILGPMYSETWFGLGGRTTATMLIAVAYGVGGAIGQLISPLFGDTRQSILVLGIMSTAVVPATFMVGTAPPSPPTFAGSKTPQSFISLLRALVGRDRTPAAHMTPRERVDYAIIVLLFGVLNAGTSAFALLTAEALDPVGYSADTAGLLGAVLLLAGIVAAIIAAPVLDRVFTHHHSRVVKTLVPILAAAWIAMIFAVKPNDTAGLFVVVTIIGVCEMVLLPVGLELGCELTRNADGSTAILWCFGNLLALIFVLAEAALRAGPDANPPNNMRTALIFNGAFIAVAISPAVFLRGKQARREVDEQKQRDLQPVDGA